MTGTSSTPNSSERPELPSASDSYDLGKMVPGAYPEDSNVVDETVRLQADSKDENSTSHNVPQTSEASGTQIQTESTRLAKVVVPDIPLSESFEKMKISNEPTTCPSVVHDEYCRSAKAHDVDDDDPLDSSEIVYQDEVRDRTSDRARGVYMPGDASEPVDRGYGEGDVAVGHGGVTYNRSGHGDILPGYPTQEGMSKLIFDRMVDDRVRQAGVDKPASESMPVAISRSTNILEGYPTNLPTKSSRNRQDLLNSGERERRREGRNVPCLDFRIIEEKRKSPIFKDGGWGEFEAVHEPATFSGSTRQKVQNRTLSAVPMAIPKPTNSPGASPTVATRRLSLPAESTRNGPAMRGDNSRSLQGEKRIHPRNPRVSDSDMGVPSYVIDGLLGCLGAPISESEEEKIGALRKPHNLERSEVEWMMDVSE